MDQKVRTHGASQMSSSLIVPISLWHDILSELQRRSAGCRESAGILVGRASPDGVRTATDVVFHHQIANDRATALSLELPEAAKFRLYQTMAKRQLTLVSLIHTHPAGWVDLSEVDQSNRLSSTVGFWSIVVPHYGRPPWNLDTMGFHILEHVGWRALSRSERANQFRLEASPCSGGKTVSLMV